MEHLWHISLTLLLYGSVFTLVYLAARPNNRDRPWLWGLIAVLLCPGVLMMLFGYLKRGKSLIGMMAYLCPSCRRPFDSQARQTRSCGICGQRV